MNVRSPLLSLVVLLAALMPCFVHGGLAADQLLTDPSFWAQSPEAFMTARRGDGFDWSSDQQATARAYRQQVSFLGFAVPECEVHFVGGQPTQWVMILYSRGENGEQEMETFQAWARNVADALDHWSGAKSVEVKKRLNTRGVGSKARAWIKTPHQVMMEWNWSELENVPSSRRYRPEFLRLILTPFDAAADPRSAAYQQKQQGGSPIVQFSRRKLKRHVQTREDGTTLIETVPMVDQGARGYCAVATTERVMRYYGMDVDQHLMAQLAQSSSERGTSSQAMMEALKQAGAKLQCRIREHHTLEYKDLERTLKNYNRIAKREKAPEIPEGVLQGDLNLPALYASLNTAYLREARLQQQADYQRFLRTIQEHVDQGIPVAWSLMMGKVDETPPTQGTGGHMRLITGYNPKTSEITYTDSWGQGHEEKRMSYADAWMITTALYTIEPRALVF